MIQYMALVVPAALVCSVLALYLINRHYVNDAIDKVYADYVGRLARLRSILFLEGSTERMAKIWLVVAACLGAGVAIEYGLVAGVAAASIGGVYPIINLNSLIKKRWERFDEQAIDAARAMAISVRAGMLVPKAMELVSTSMDAPISQEFGVVLKEYGLGMPLEDSMNGLTQRARSESFSAVVSAIQVARRAGGDIPHVLEETSTALSDVKKMEGKLQAVTSQGRMQIFVMALIPPAFMGFMFTVQPDQVQLLFADIIGNAILLGIVVLEIVGVFVMYQIINVEI